MDNVVPGTDWVMAGAGAEALGAVGAAGEAGVAGEAAGVGGEFVGLIGSSAIPSLENAARQRSTSKCGLMETGNLSPKWKQCRVPKKLR